MSTERLQKLMARAGIASRRKVEELILEGRVTVNGRVATLGDKADLEIDSVKLDGKRIRPPERQRYLLLNKPKGVLTTVADDKGRPTVMELIPDGLRNGLFPVGRLDFHTEGLLLLTTDGEFAQRIAHPRFGCRKLYEVKVKGLPREEEIEKLRRGIVLDGRRTLPAHIAPLRRTSRAEDEGNTWYEVQLGEGRSRQIREMFFRIGHPVQKLKRVAIGPLRDTSLGSGMFRPLDEKEIEALRKAGESGTAMGAGPARARGGGGVGRIDRAEATRPASFALPAERRRGTGSRSRPAPSVAGPRSGRPEPGGLRPALRTTEGEVRPSRPVGRTARPLSAAGRPSTATAPRGTRAARGARTGPRAAAPAAGRPARRPNEAPWRREGAESAAGRGVGRPSKPARPGSRPKPAAAGVTARAGRPVRRSNEAPWKREGGDGASRGTMRPSRPARPGPRTKRADGGVMPRAYHPGRGAAPVSGRKRPVSGETGPGRGPRRPSPSRGGGAPRGGRPPRPAGGRRG